MRIRDLIKKPGFWVGVAGLIVIIAQLFGMEVNSPYINEILSGLCSVLVVIGFLTTKEKKEIDKELDKDDKPHGKDNEDGKLL